MLRRPIIDADWNLQNVRRRFKLKQTTRSNGTEDGRWVGVVKERRKHFGKKTQQPKKEPSRAVWPKRTPPVVFFLFRKKFHSELWHLSWQQAITPSSCVSFLFLSLSLPLCFSEFGGFFLNCMYIYIYIHFHFLNCSSQVIHSTQRFFNFKFPEYFHFFLFGERPGALPFPPAFRLSHCNHLQNFNNYINITVREIFQKDRWFGVACPRGMLWK